MLFVKNLHQKVTEDDLFALFGRFHGNGGSPIKIRVMKGRMNGQAFVEFESESACPHEVWTTKVATV